MTSLNAMPQVAKFHCDVIVNAVPGVSPVLTTDNIDPVRAVNHCHVTQYVALTSQPAVVIWRPLSSEQNKSTRCNMAAHVTSCYDAVGGVKITFPALNLFPMPTDWF